MILDKVQTENLINERKYQEFHKWLHKNGAIYDKIRYPAVFNSPQGPILGCLAEEDINPREAYAFIPNTICISTEKARNSEISHVYRKHPELFENNGERDYYVMILFLMYERAKGIKSFWHPYFEICEISDIPAQWSDEEIEKIGSIELKDRIYYFKEQLTKDWPKLQSIIRSEEIFEQDLMDEELFKWATSLESVIVKRSPGLGSFSS